MGDLAAATTPLLYIVSHVSALGQPVSPVDQSEARISHIYYSSVPQAFTALCQKNLKHSSMRQKATDGEQGIEPTRTELFSLLFGKMPHRTPLTHGVLFWPTNGSRRSSHKFERQ